MSLAVVIGTVIRTNYKLLPVVGVTGATGVVYGVVTVTFGLVAGGYVVETTLVGARVVLAAAKQVKTQLYF